MRISVMACSQTITCPACGSSEVRKAGYNAHDVPRYRCANELCSKKSFMLTYRYKAYELGIKETIVDMALNSSGVRDTARVLGVSKGTVISMIYPRNSRQS